MYLLLGCSHIVILVTIVLEVVFQFMPGLFRFIMPEMKSYDMYGCKRR